MDKPQSPQTNPYVIACWMQRGGCGKTTHSLEVATNLASLGYKVLLIDADPQYDLTKVIMDPIIEAKWEGDYEKFLYEGKDMSAGPQLDTAASLFDMIQDIHSAKPQRPPKTHFCYSFSNDGGVWLLPGSPNLSDWDFQLANGHNMLHSTPLVMSYLTAANESIKIAAKSNYDNKKTKVEIDFVVLDMGPYPGALNGCLLMCANYFILPIFLDNTTILNIKVATDTIVKWHARQTREYIPVISRYPHLAQFPTYIPKCLGLVVANYNYRKIGKVEENGVVADGLAVNLIAQMNKSKLVMETAMLKLSRLNPPMVIECNNTPILAQIRRFEQIGIIGQIEGLPVSFLTEEDMIKVVGNEHILMEKTEKKQNYERSKTFREIYNAMVCNMISLMRKDGAIIRNCDQNEPGELLVPRHLLERREKYKSRNKDNKERKRKKEAKGKLMPKRTRNTRDSTIRSSSPVPVSKNYINRLREDINNRTIAKDTDDEDDFE